MGRLRVLADLIAFLSRERRYWLLPLVAILLAIGLLVAALESPIAPLLYPLF